MTLMICCCCSSLIDTMRDNMYVIGLMANMWYQNFYLIRLYWSLRKCFYFVLSLSSSVLFVNSRTLTAVHDAILEELVYPSEIVGKRTRVKLDGSKLIKVWVQLSVLYFSMLQYAQISTVNLHIFKPKSSIIRWPHSASTFFFSDAFESPLCMQINSKLLWKRLVALVFLWSFSLPSTIRATKDWQPSNNSPLFRHLDKLQQTNVEHKVRVKLWLSGAQHYHIHTGSVPWFLSDDRRCRPNLT